MAEAGLVLAGIAAMTGWIVAIGIYGMYQEQSRHLKDALSERDTARAEVREWTDAMARANRTPVLRAIAVSETVNSSKTPPPYWEGQQIITKITSS
jgi:hypothetical protein